MQIPPSKKTVKWLLILIGIPAYIWVGAGVYGMYQIEHFAPLTFDKILSSGKALAHYGITKEKSDPSAFGAKNFQEVTFPSKPDNLLLSAWYIAPKQSPKGCLVFLHGRTANRLRTIKYLSLYKEIGKTQDYGMFFLDFRNSGKSEPSDTALGYEFAEDLTSALEFLNSRFGHKDFIIHAFSTGAMATGLFFHRKELQQRIQSRDIRIRALIFDSPLSNIEESYHLAAKRKFGLPRFVLAGGILFFGLHQPFDLDEMRLGTVARDYADLPVLILQGERDHTTPAYALRRELELLKNPDHIKVRYFPKGEHVQIYQDPRYKKEYKKQVKDFLAGIS